MIVYYASNTHILLPLYMYTGLRGLISCISFNPDRCGAYAAGCYAYGVGVYVENQSECALELTGLSCGVSSVKWSKDGNCLWIGKLHV